jgi:hypothetical protein
MCCKHLIVASALPVLEEEREIAWSREHPIYENMNKKF